MFTNFSSNLPTEVLFCESYPSLCLRLQASKIVVVILIISVPRYALMIPSKWNQGVVQTKNCYDPLSGKTVVHYKLNQHMNSVMKATQRARMGSGRVASNGPIPFCDVLAKRGKHVVISFIHPRQHCGNNNCNKCFELPH